MIDNIKNLFKDETEYYDTDELEVVTENEKDDTFNIETTSDTSKTRGSKSIVKIYEPVTKTATSTIIDSIKRGELCIVNFSKVSEEEARIIYSTLSGSIFALDGILKMVDTHVMLCAPKNFLVDGDVSE